MKKVFLVGVFDLFHLGHLRLFERAKELGGWLTVAVQTAEYITKTKPGTTVVYSLDERMEMVSSIKYVDSVVEYEAVDKTIKEVNFDIFVVGPDQTHGGFQRAMEYCRRNGKEVVVLGRTKNISSSELKKKIERVSW